MPCFPVDGIQGFLFGEKVKLGKSEKGWFAVVAILSFILPACSGSGAENVNSKVSRDTNVSKVVPTRIVTDDLGRQITIPTDVKRAISLAPSVTESIFAVGAGDRLVGDTTYCNYPEEAKAIQKVGDTLNPNMEAIVALKPDVVFVSGASQLETFTKTLDQNGIGVYVMNPKDLKDVFKNLIQLGDLFGTSDQAQKLADDLQMRFIRGPYPSLPPKNNRIFVQISKEPLFTIGKDSFLNEIVVAAQGESVTRNIETAFPKISKETALALNPDVIILSDSPDNQEPNEAFKDSPAVKNGRVYKIDADIISRPGPRLIDALEQIAKDLHPEKLK